MKKRVFELDFVRALAAILIIMTHFNARYMFIGTPEAYSKMIVGIDTFNIYIGALGVSLFLIISGAALMLTYENNFTLKKFWKKRFLSIYPMFWLAYFVAFLHHFYHNKGLMFAQAPKFNIIYSILGIDGYLSNANVPTFYLLGEWFLGLILLIYVIFPILRWGVIKHPIITFLVGMGLYVFGIIYQPDVLPQNMVLFVRLPEVLFGMYFQKYVKEVKWFWVIIAVGVLGLNTCLKPEFNQCLQTTYIGIAAFIVLFFVGKWIKNLHVITRFCEIISKYSYAIFLTHHYIIAFVMAEFDLNTITVCESYILFILICCLIAIFTKLLFAGNEYMMKHIWNRLGNKGNK